MIILHKKMLGYAAGCLFLFFSILSCLCLVADGETSWFFILFFDKLVVFLLSLPFLLGTLFVERTITPTVITRTPNRIHALFLELVQQYFLGFIYLTVWFILLVLFSLMKFGGIFSGEDAVLILLWYVRFLLGFTIMANCSVLLKKSNIKLFASASSMIVYLFFAIEVLAVVPELDKQLGIEINLVFSWMFCDSAVGLAVMSALLLILTGGLLVAAKREELF